MGQLEAQIKQQKEAKQSAIDQINKLLAAKSQAASKVSGRSWTDPEVVVSRPFKLIHLLVIAILFMLLGSYLGRKTQPVQAVPAVEDVVVTETIVAVGINFISKQDKAAVIEELTNCADNDYFERGLELAIEKKGIKIEPVDISDLFAVEVDFQADLDRANSSIN